jgi:hypothetical protein
MIEPDNITVNVPPVAFSNVPFVSATAGTFESDMGGTFTPLLSKPFYYKKPDATDNYSDIIQNISRSFTDMKAMRDKVVNKKQCTELRQIQRTARFIKRTKPPATPNGI